MKRSMYPPDLIAILKREWLKPRPAPQKARPPLPTDEMLRTLLDTCFEASLLREEGRRLAFRVIDYPRTEFDSDLKHRQADPAWERCIAVDRVTILSEPRQFSVAELHRLAPAADVVRSLICVESTSGGVVIWGLLDAGESWWNLIHHQPAVGRPPPDRLAIGSQNPGELTISCGGHILFSLRVGKLVFPSRDVLDDGLVADFTRDAREQLHGAVVKELGAATADSKYPIQHFYNSCLLRVLFKVREKGHGGTIILLPHGIDKTDSRITDRLTIKYPCEYDYVWDLMVRSIVNHQRFYDLHFQLWNAKLPVEKYQQVSILDLEKSVIEESLSDCFRFIASLCAVDGALVITDRMSVLGFGAEVTALSPTLRSVEVGHDSTATERSTLSIESYGTRHRSAFRFCSSFENAIAFVVSQDGGVKVIKRHGPHVILWPDINMGSLAI
jgi:hypothetical protein